MFKIKAQTIILITLVISLVAIIGCVAVKKDTNEKNLPPSVAGNIEFSPKIKEILSSKLSILQKFSEDELFLIFSAEENKKNNSLTLKQIKNIDKQWIANSPEIEKFVQDKSTSENALSLVRFQENFPGFMEIFVTDKKGVITATTNRTSDYYQADEDWWIQCFNEGKGQAYYESVIDYDQSSQSEGVGMYMPIYEKDQNSFQGCIKAFFSVAAIYQEVINQEDNH